MNLFEKLKEINNTDDCTEEFDPQDIAGNKMISVLAYMGWLVLIPLFCAKNSAYARFHCNQGLMLAIAEIGIALAAYAFDGLPVIGGVFRVISQISVPVCFVFALLGAINASRGRAKELPLIGSCRVLK